MKHKSLGFRGCLLQSESLFWHLSYPVCDTAHLKGDNYNENKILTAISTIMLFVRGRSCHCVPLIGRWNPGSGDYGLQLRRLYDFSGIFSILSYTKGKVKSKLMQVCVVINSIYAVGAIAIIGMNIVTRIGG